MLKSTIGAALLSPFALAAAPHAIPGILVVAAVSYLAEALGEARVLLLCVSRISFAVFFSRSASLVTPTIVMTSSSAPEDSRRVYVISYPCRPHPSAAIVLRVFQHRASSSQSAFRPPPLLPRQQWMEKGNPFLTCNYMHFLKFKMIE